MQRFLRLIIWDALFCIVPAMGYAASVLLGTSAANDAVILLTVLVCGAFLAQLSRWGCSMMELIVVALPGLYLALAPFLAPLLNAIPLPFPLVPAVLLMAQTRPLRLAGALAAGFVLWQRTYIRIS